MSIFDAHFGLSRKKDEEKTIKVVNNKPNERKSEATQASSNSKPKITVEKPKYGKQNTNNPITEETMKKAKAKGISQSTLESWQHEEDINDMKKEFANYRSMDYKAKSLGDLQYGIENTERTKADAEKKRLMDKYGVSEKEFNIHYSNYDTKEKKADAEKTAKEAKEYAKAHPVKGSLKSIGTNLLTPIEGVANTVASLHGDKLDTTSDFLIKNKAEAQREGAKENIKNNALKKTYDFGMSGADMVAQVVLGALTGGGSMALGAMQGAQTANDMVQNTLKNGNSAYQAGVAGLGGGAVGALLAKGGMDVITDKIIPEAVGKSILGNAAKAFVTEGSEEVVENIADNLIDKGASALFKGKDNKKAAIREYNKQGMTNAEAEEAYKADRKQELINDFVAGGLMGGAVSGAGSAKAKIDRARINAGKTNTTVEKLLNGKQIDRPLEEVDILNDRTLDKKRVPFSGEEISLEEASKYKPETPYKTGDLIDVRNIKAGRNTRVKNIYTGTDAPIQGTKNDAIVPINPDSSINAKNNIESVRTAKGIDRTALINIYKAIFDKQTGGELVVPVNGATQLDSQYEVTVNKSAIKKVINNIKDTPDASAKVAILENLENVIKNSDLITSSHNVDYSDVDSDNKARVKDGRYDYFETVVDIDGKNYVVNFTVFSSDYNKYRTHEIKEINLQSEGNTTVEITGAEASNEGLSSTNISQVGNNVNSKEQATAQPNTETNVSNNEGVERERSYPKSVDLPEEFKKQLNDKTYTQLSNQSVIDDATSFAEGKSDSEVLSEFYRRLDKFDPTAVVMGKNLADKLREQGDYKTAVDIIDAISEKMTRGGQFTQAAYITALKGDPRSIEYSIEKDIAKINEEGQKKFGNKWKDFGLTDAERQAFEQMQSGDTEAIESLTDSIYKRMAKEYPYTVWEKFYDVAKHCMLLNPRTHIRNVAANAISMPVRSMSDRVKAVMEGMYGMVDKDYKRTSSLTGGSKEAKAIASKVFDTSIKDMIDDGDKWSQEGTGRLQKESQMFKDGVGGKQIKAVSQKLANGNLAVVKAIDRLSGGKLNELTGIVDNVSDLANNKVTGNVMENIRQMDYWLLGDVEDVPFVKQNFVNALSNYMTAQNITSEADIPPEAISIALDEALKATFKDDNAFTEALSTIKKKTGKFGDIAMPFTKTPANLAMRGFEYSPAGIVKSVNDFVKTKRANGGEVTNADLSRFFGDLSKNITGTGLIFAGYALAKAGMITGGYSDDKNERNYQKLRGFQPNALHINGKYYTFDWAQPTSIPLIIGQAMYEGSQKDDEETNKALQIAKAMYNGGVSSVDAWFNLSPLQNVAELMGGGEGSQYGDNSIASNVLETVTNFPLAYIPSAMGATARAVDPTMRNTFDKTSGLNTFKNQAIAKIPGLSKSLPASYDVWGRERKRSGSEGEAAFAQFVNPGTLGYDNPTQVDNFLQGIFDKTKDGKVFPRAAEYNIEGRQLNNKEYSERQRVQGQKSLELVKAYQKVAKQNGLTDDENIALLSDLYSAAKQYTDKTLYNKGYSMGTAEAEAFEKGADAYAEYLKDKAMAKRNNMTYDQYMKKMNEGGQEAVDAYNASKEEVNSINSQLGEDAKTITVDAYDKYVEKGATKEDIVFLQTLKANASTDGKDGISNKEKLDYLSKQNMTDAERSHYIELMATKDSLNSKYVQRGVQQFGTSAYYQIFMNKTKADGDGNGSLTQKEAKSYVNATFKNANERAKWYFVLTGKQYK